VLAWFIDGVVLFLPVYLLWIYVAPEQEIISVRGVYYQVPRASLLAYVFIAVTFWLYSALWESSRWQATVGKQVVGLMVVGLDQSKISFGTASLRAWPFYLMGFAVVLDRAFGTEGNEFEMVGEVLSIVSCIAVAFTPMKQGFHDKMAKCLVVRNVG
jgi:uncharacterized RDD family membrane protein YckC